MRSRNAAGRGTGGRHGGIRPALGEGPGRREGVPAGCPRGLRMGSGAGRFPPPSKGVGAARGRVREGREGVRRGGRRGSGARGAGGGATAAPVASNGGKARCGTLRGRRPMPPPPSRGARATGTRCRVRMTVSASARLPPGRREGAPTERSAGEGRDGRGRGHHVDVSASRTRGDCNPRAAAGPRWEARRKALRDKGLESANPVQRVVLHGADSRTSGCRAGERSRRALPHDRAGRAAALARAAPNARGERRAAPRTDDDAPPALSPRRFPAPALGRPTRRTMLGSR